MEPNNGSGVFMSLWKEHLYAQSKIASENAQFYSDALKGNHMEGKMSAREMQFTRAFGPPVSANPTGP